MGNLLNPAITIGPIVLVLGIVCAAACCMTYLLNSGPKAGAVLWRFIVLVVAIGLAAFVAGSAIGIAAFCASPDSGNLCGLGGIFGTGPLLSGLSIGGYAYYWLQDIRSRPGR